MLLVLSAVVAGCGQDALPGSGGIADLGTVAADLPGFAPSSDLAPPWDLARPLCDGGASECRTISFDVMPGAAELQIALWIEDSAGHFIDTVYLTQRTGIYGLGNRPGAALLKTDFKWSYGRREMVLPVWAHRRNHRYPKLVMGGACGNSAKTLCPDGTPCGEDCSDDTIVYHPKVSSFEPFYCSPSGASRIDALSCASRGTFSKGAFADAPAFSLYPPRADLVKVYPSLDAKEVATLAALNDTITISRATPRAGAPVAPRPVWSGTLAHCAADGDYVAWIELSAEYDFNQFHNHPNQPDPVMAWDFMGRPFLGQPSVVYKTAFHLGREKQEVVATSASYVGYGSWDGSDGALRPPDGTITTDKPGSGSGRLQDLNDGGPPGRFRVRVTPCTPGK